MKKFMIIRNPYDQSLAVWEYIDDVKEAMKYWYVKHAIDKYGVEDTMPIVMNRMGGYHTHRPDAPDVVKIVESETWPDLRLWEMYPMNSKHFKTGWISPDGTTFLCAYEDHIECAETIRKIMYDGAHPGMPADEMLLEYMGWGKCTNKTYIVYKDKMTDAMAKYFIDNGFTNRLEVLTK